MCRYDASRCGSRISGSEITLGALEVPALTKVSRPALPCSSTCSRRLSQCLAHIARKPVSRSGSPRLMLSCVSMNRAASTSFIES